jgi:hypothetical protein
MRATEFISEIQNIPQSGYTGGETELHLSPLKDIKGKFYPLPGYVGYQYNLVQSKQSITLRVFDTNASIEPEPKPPKSIKKDFPYLYSIGMRKYDNYLIQKKKGLQVAKINLIIANFPVKSSYMVTTVTVHEKYRGIGLAKAMYSTILNSGVTIISGSQQTPGGQRNWLNLNTIPGVEVKGYVVIHRSLTNYKTHYNKQMVSKFYDDIMALGGQFIGKNKSYEYWAFDIVAGESRLEAYIKNRLSKLYNPNENYNDYKTGLFARKVQ